LEQEVITGQASGITLCCTAFSKTCSSKASVLGDGSAVRKGKIRSDGALAVSPLVAFTVHLQALKKVGKIMA
jgi:hypothetical protein